MSRIFVTGDLHGDHDSKKLSTENFAVQKELSKDDYVIICGDFGCVWTGDSKCPENVKDRYEIPGALRHYWGKDTYMLDWLENKNFTTLFVDGNHENHALLSCYPREEWNGGQVQVIRPGVIHLCRGQVYDIDGKSFFVMGGARSHDIAYRKKDISWWAEEMPSVEEYEEAKHNLARANWNVDYILTHEATSKVIEELKFRSNELAEFLSELDEKTEYTKWFFGHYHSDNCELGKHKCLYNQVVEL